MKMAQLKNVRRARRCLGIRKRLVGTPERPRLAISRSLKHVYAQIIDDMAGRTLVSASTVEAKIPKGGNRQAAQTVGKLLAEKAWAAGIVAIAFDRRGYKYHGRVKALADAAREAGLKF